MPPEEKNWKTAQRQGGRGVHTYVTKKKLKKLEEEGVLDLDKEIEYSTSVSATSDGRARVFVSLRNAE